MKNNKKIKKSNKTRRSRKNKIEIIDVEEYCGQEEMKDKAQKLDKLIRDKVKILLEAIEKIEFENKKFKELN